MSNYQSSMLENNNKITLKCKRYEYLPISSVYLEYFPYWSQPFSHKTIHDFKNGERVMNINSSLRDYIPFGLRGTVVGKT